MVEAFKVHILSEKELTIAQIRANERKAAAEQRRAAAEEGVRLAAEEAKRLRIAAKIELQRRLEEEATAKLQAQVQAKLERAARYAAKYNEGIGVEIANAKENSIRSLPHIKRLATQPALDIQSLSANESASIQTLAMLYQMEEQNKVNVISELTTISAYSNHTLARQLFINQHLDATEPLKEDESMIGGGDMDPYAIIQLDFKNELHFIMLMAYYHVQLRKLGVDSIEANEYMSTPNILKDALAYFKPRMSKETKPSVKPAQNFAAFHAALSKKKLHSYKQVPVVPFTPMIPAYGGKRRTKRRTKKHAKKRRTRKN
jgi:hypothetical protein